MANPVIHFEVRAKDAAKAQQFYASVFDWKVDANNPMQYGMVSGEAPGIGGGIGPAPDGASKVTFYVEVDDLDAYLEKVKQAGGHTLAPPMDVPGGPTMATFADPEGNEVGLVKSGSMGGGSQ